MAKALLEYVHLDVFSREAFAGNGVIVFPRAERLEDGQMLRIAEEMRQYESIFLSPGPDPRTRKARIFTVEEELPFAGHPLLGAAAALHDEASGSPEADWVLVLADGREVPVQTGRRDGWTMSVMDQGGPEFGRILPPEARDDVLDAFGLSFDDLEPGLPAQVVSTGLPYLIVPLRSGLDRAAIRVPDLAEKLAAFGAKFAYLLDVHEIEARTWDNGGRWEDVATGSAAGPAGAYLVEHGLARADGGILVQQGRFAGRPSRIVVKVERRNGAVASVKVGGEVSVVAKGSLLRLP